jgi:hypothetical protein
MDKATQVNFAAEVRKNLRDAGDVDTFHKLNNIDDESIRYVLEQLATNAVEVAHNNLLDKANRVLNVNIIDEIRKRFSSSDEKLNAFIKDCISYGATYLQYDQNEINKASGGTARKVKMNLITVMMPPSKNASDVEFAEKIKSVIKDNVPDAVIVEHEYNSDFSVVSITNLIPLRIIKSIKAPIRDRYQSLVNDTNGEENKYILHIENHEDSLPPLFIPTQNEREENIKQSRDGLLPYLLLAYQLGIIQTKANEKGLKEYVIIILDEYGIEESTIQLGLKLETMAEHFVKEEADIPQVQPFIDKVQDKLDKEYKLIEKRKDLLKSLMENIQPYNQLTHENPVRRQMNEAAKTIKKILEL